MAGRRAPGYHVGWAQALRNLGVRYELTFAERKMLAWGERARAYQDALKAEQ